MTRRTLLQTIASLPLMGWLRPNDAGPVEVDWYDCDHCIDLPSIPQVGACCMPSAWLVTVPCPDCHGYMQVSTGPDQHATCPDCGAKWVGRVHYDGVPQSLMWDWKRA